MHPSKPLILVKRYHLEPQTGTAFTVSKDHIIRIIDVEGEQVADLVCFAHANPAEYLSSSRSIDYNEKIYISTEDVLYSNLSRPMCSIIADQVGKHDFLFAPCSQEMFEISNGIIEPHPNCLDNLASGLKAFGIKEPQIPTAFNIFMNANISERGDIKTEPPKSKAGDYIDLRAEMGLIVGVTACSSKQCNNYKCPPIDVEVYSRKPSE